MHKRTKNQKGLVVYRVTYKHNLPIPPFLRITTHLLTSTLLCVCCFLYMSGLSEAFERKKKIQFTWLATTTQNLMVRAFATIQRLPASAVNTNCEYYRENILKGPPKLMKDISEQWLHVEGRKIWKRENLWLFF